MGKDLELTPVEILMMKNISLEVELLNVRAAELNRAGMNTSKAIADRLGVSVDEYNLDLEKGRLIPVPTSIASKA